MKFPTYKEMGEKIAEQALDEYVINGKTLREWIKLLSEQEPCEDAVSKADMIAFLEQGREYVSRNRDQYKTAREFDIADTIYVNLVQAVKHLPSVNLQEPKKCKDCKWWKDSDGVYRRGVGAESQCPINTVSVANGWGYCYRFEPQEVRDKE